jgi:hypothetical protein
VSALVLVPRVSEARECRVAVLNTPGSPDPDGLRVELQIDNFATMDEAHACLAGPELAQNPIGVIFDPEQLIRDYEAGVAFDDFQRRPPLPPGKTPMDMRAERPRA